MIKPGILLSYGLLLTLLLVNHCIFAVTVNQSLTQLTPTDWEAEFTIINDGGLSGASLQGFYFEFDPLTFAESSLTINTTPPLSSQWNEVILGSVPGGIAAHYDALSSSGGIASGQSQGGFKMRFNYSGNGIPPQIPFSVYHPATFAEITRGQSNIKSVQSLGTPIPTFSPWISTLLILLIVIFGRYFLSTRNHKAQIHNNMLINHTRPKIL